MERFVVAFTNHHMWNDEPLLEIQLTYAENWKDALKKITPSIDFEKIQEIDRKTIDEKIGEEQFPNIYDITFIIPKSSEWDQIIRIIKIPSGF